MNSFLTKDLYFASYLYCCGCELDSVSKKDGITMFVFDRTSRLSELVESYFSRNALVDPIQYDDALKTLRNLTLGPKSVRKDLPSFVAA
jgi:hypothetical protein